MAQTIGGSTSQLLASPIGAETSQRGCLSAKTEASHGTEYAKKVLSVAGTRVLTTATASKFRERVIAGLNGHDVIEVDLSGTTFMDCGGLGALIALRNATRDRKGRVRLLNPTPPVEQVLTLLEAQRVFEIVTARPGC
jgi:anti-sigma B factor antagonist